MEAQKHHPEGYMTDSQGRLVPLESIKEVDQLRDQLVKEIVANAKAQQQSLKAYKADTLGEIQSFVELSGEKYGAALGGQKGNVSLVSYDGRYRVQRAISEYLTFGEQLQAAKALIDECIHEWTTGSRMEIQVLINDAFQVDKEGNVSTGRILGLRKLDIKAPKWAQAMEAIADSIQITGSKTYVRVYERVGDSDQWKPIALDVAAI